MTGTPAAAQHLRNLAILRSVRDRIDRGYAQPLDVEALARGAHMSVYRDPFGFEDRGDVGYGGMHGLTVGPPGQPGTSIVLYPPAAMPGMTDDERRTIAELMAEDTFASINLATTDLDGTFELLQTGDAEVIQEPTDQPYGIRDRAFRDPSGNLIRIREVR